MTLPATSLAPHPVLEGRSLPYAELKEGVLNWALGQIDGVIDVNAEDIVNLYEFAVEHAQNRK